jgi:hypothetical protein
MEQGRTIRRGHGATGLVHDAISIIVTRNDLIRRCNNRIVDVVIL